jgi:hypothetical protein
MVVATNKAIQNVVKDVLADPAVREAAKNLGRTVITSWTTYGGPAAVGKLSG